MIDYQALCMTPINVDPCISTLLSLGIDEHLMQIAFFSRVRSNYWICHLDLIHKSMMTCKIGAYKGLTCMDRRPMGPRPTRSTSVQPRHMSV